MALTPLRKRRGVQRSARRVLVLSSTEALPIARAVQSELSTPTVECIVWDQARFSGWLLSEVFSKIAEHAFIVLLVSGDDVIVSRGTKTPGPRDNILVELGMALASKGVEHTFLLCPKPTPFKLPSDLGGLVVRRYDIRSDGNWRAAVSPACQEILEDIESATHRGLAMSESIFHRAVLDLNKTLITSFRRTPDIVIGVNHGGAVVGGLLYYLNRQRFHFTVFWIDVDSNLRPRSSRQQDAREELGILVEQLRVQGRHQPLILLVDDTLRSGRAMLPALKIVEDVAPSARVVIGVILYRPDLAQTYDPAKLSGKIVTPDPQRFAPGSYDKIFYE